MEKNREASKDARLNFGEYLLLPTTSNGCARELSVTIALRSKRNMRAYLGIAPITFAHSFIFSGVAIDSLPSFAFLNS